MRNGCPLRFRCSAAPTIQSACQCALALVIVALVAGCSWSRRYSDVPTYWPVAWDEAPNQGVGRFKSTFLVDQVDSYYRGVNPGPIGITTLVNVDDLYSTSTFGRVYAEQIMSELAMRGYDVVELRHADALQFLSNKGEFALSRDRAMVREARDLGGVIVGTYAVSPVRVYINVRLLDPATSLVLSAGSVEMSKTPEITRLLRGGSFPATLERIPVRHIGISTYPMTMFPSEMSRVYDLEESGTGAWRSTPQFVPAQPAAKRRGETVHK